MGDLPFINTSNGLMNPTSIPSPDAPSFIAMDKTPGKFLTDKSPFDNILYGQWSSPAVGILHTTGQFAGGDGWVYSLK